MPVDFLTLQNNLVLLETIMRLSVVWFVFVNWDFRKSSLHLTLKNSKIVHARIFVTNIAYIRLDQNFLTYSKT